MNRTPENLLMVLKFNVKTFNQKNLDELMSIWPQKDGKHINMTLQEFYNIITTLKTIRKVTIEEFEKVLAKLE